LYCGERDGGRVPVSTARQDERGNTMTNNFLITLRNDTGCGCPGIGFGTPGCIEIPDTNTNYDVRAAMDPQQWLNHIPDTSVLVFVHGFGNDSCKIIERHNTIKPHVPPGVTLASFDWPSGNPGFSAYQNDKLNAASSAPYFIANCLKVLFRKFPPGNVHLFGHSMGAYVIEQVFQTPQVFTVGHVLLAAGDVDQLNYGAGTPLLANYLSHCNNLSVYWSQDDQALLDSQRINHYVPLGLQGFKGVVPDRCYSIDSAGYFRNYAKNDPPPAPPPPPPPNLPIPPISAAEYSHVWYLLYAPKPPPVNDFYTDVGAVLQGYLTFPTRAPKPPPPLPPDKNSFALQRPKA
jgi:pimeloyl-ACP methyl ester carboxylesterase